MRLHHCAPHEGTKPQALTLRVGIPRRVFGDIDTIVVVLDIVFALQLLLPRARNVAAGKTAGNNGNNDGEKEGSSK